MVVYTGDWQSRTAIAPPVTSLEGAKVILNAGTSSEADKQDYVWSDVRQTLSDTQARKESDTQSERQLSAHTDTNTSLLGYIASLHEQLKKTQAEKEMLLKQVVERSSSSTSVKDQLSILRNDVADLKNHLVPKINSLQEIQMLKLPLLEEKINANSDELAGIHGRLDGLDERLNETESLDHARFQTIQRGIVHLNDGMMHLYHIIKDSRTPNAEERAFFEDLDDVDDSEGNRGRDQAPKPLEDPSTKGEKKAESTKGEHQEETRRDKGKGKEAEAETAPETRRDKGKEKVTEEAPDDEYYHDEQGDFNFMEDVGAVAEDEEYVAEEGDDEIDVDNWEEVRPPSPGTTAEILAARAELKRKEVNYNVLSNLITKQKELSAHEKAQKQELHKIALQKRKLDIRLKQGDSWAFAKEVMTLPHWCSHDNDRLYRHLHPFRTANPDHDDYFAALRNEVVGIKCGHDQMNNELGIFIELKSTSTLRCTLDFFNDKTLTELYVFYSRLPRAGNLIELVRDRLWSLARKASPEVVNVPWAVRFIKSSNFQSVYLNSEKMPDYSAAHLVWVEHHLLNTGSHDPKKIEAAKYIQAYAEENFPKRYLELKNKMRGHRRQPVMPEGLISQAERVLDPYIVKTLEEGKIHSEEEDQATKD